MVTTREMERQRARSESGDPVGGSEFDVGRADIQELSRPGEQSRGGAPETNMEMFAGLFSQMSEQISAMQAEIRLLRAERTSVGPQGERLVEMRTQIGNRVPERQEQYLDNPESTGARDEVNHPPECVGHRDVLYASGGPDVPATTTVPEAPTYSTPRVTEENPSRLHPSTEQVGRAPEAVSASEARGRESRIADPVLATILKDQILIYDPDKTVGAKAWMEKFEEYIGLLNLSALTSRKIFMATKLKGRATSWMESTGNRMSSWPQLRNEFLAEFVDALAIERAWGTLHRLRDFTSFQRYRNEFQRVARETEEDFWTCTRLRSLFYYNLASRRKEKLLTYAFSQGRRVEALSIKEMIELLSFIDLAYAGESRDRPATKERQPAPENREVSRDAWRNKSARNGDGKARRLQEVTCHHCKKKGHYKTSCPDYKATVATVVEEEEPPTPDDDDDDGNDGDNDVEQEEMLSLNRVYASEVMGPESNGADIKPLQLLVEANEELNKRARSRVAREASAEIVKVFDQKKEMLMDVKVAGILTTALVDTGATRSCIDLSLVKKADLPIIGKPITARMANTAMMTIQGDVIVEVEALGKTVSSRMMACDLQQPDRPVILGRDVLREIGVNIRLEKEREEILNIAADNYLCDVGDDDDDDETEEESVDEREVAAVEAVVAEQVQSQQERPPCATVILPKELSEYADVFSPDDISVPPVRPNFDMRIDLVGSAPTSVRQYRLTAAEREELHKQVTKLRQAGHIQPSNSVNVSPVLFVPKKNGEKRLCVDYRRLNAVTKSVPNNLPLIEDILDNLHGKTVFSSLDLRSGYHQLGLAADSRHLTAFQAGGTTYEYTVVPFGLKNAPSVFQRFMQHIVSGIPSAYVYLDDIIVASASKEENIDGMKMVLARMREHKLRCRLEKCSFFQNEIEYLGHRVTGKGLQVQAAKVAAVMKTDRPTDVSTVRSFLGITGYYRRFIRGYSAIARPLTDLLRKDAKFVWSEPQEGAFQELKSKLASAPVLALPDPDLDYILTTDASDIGIGAVLSQRGRPVAFFSRRLAPAQSRYSTGEKELLAIVMAVDHFRHLLDGKKMVVETDHKNLVSVLTRHKLNGRVVRAITFLQQFDITLRYLEGKENVVADHLSRHPPTVSSLAVFELSCRHFEDLVLETSKDVEVDELVKKGVGEKKNGLLYYDNKAFVPVTLRGRVISAHHDDAYAGHRGAEATARKIKRSFWWPTMEADVRDYIQRCDICQTSKAANRKPLGKTQPLELPTQKFQQISVDFVTHLPLSNRNRDAVCVIVDTSTKYAVFVAVSSRDTAAKVAQTVLTKWVLKGFGLPREVISDRDPKFTAQFWKSLMSRLGAHLRMSSARHPRTDGQTERTIRTFNEFLRAFVGSSGKNWEAQLPFAEFAYNDSANSTGFSPFELVLGQNPELPWQLILPGKAEMESVQEFCGRMQRNITRALNALEKSRKRTAKRADMRRREGAYKVGEQVYINTRLFKNMLPGVARFKPSFIGPYTITKKLHNSYQLDLRGEHRLHPVFNTTELKPAAKQ